EHQRLRDRVRGQDRAVDSRILLGGVSSTVAAAPEQAGGAGLGPALKAARSRLGLVAALFAIAAAGWWWTGDRMAGMDDGPWTALGTLSWFLGAWVVMMAAMMLPSVAPTVALYSRMTK